MVNRASSYFFGPDPPLFTPVIPFFLPLPVPNSFAASLNRPPVPPMYISPLQSESCPSPRRLGRLRCMRSITISYSSFAGHNSFNTSFHDRSSEPPRGAVFPLNSRGSLDRTLVFRLLSCRTPRSILAAPQVLRARFFSLAVDPLFSLRRVFFFRVPLSFSSFFLRFFEVGWRH